LIFLCEQFSENKNQSNQIFLLNQKKTQILKKGNKYIELARLRAEQKFDRKSELG